MSRYIAYSPNGQAYQCDTLAEVRRVEGTRKKRNGSCGCKKNPGKRRNGDCGCQKNPRRRLVRNARPSHWPEEKVATPKQRSAFEAKLVKMGVPPSEAYKLSHYNPKSQWQDILQWASGEYRRRRNPSEDYSLGVFQGAMEHGKLPPDKGSSAEFKRGYSNGRRLGVTKPEARAQALGVFKATGSQRQGGEILEEAAQGLSTVQNPHKRRNPGCGCSGLKRNPGCGCKKNPRNRPLARNARPLGWPEEKPATAKQTAAFADKLVKLGVPYTEASKMSQMHPKSEWQDILFWASREYSSRKRRNPTPEEHRKRGWKTLESGQEALSKANASLVPGDYLLAFSDGVEALQDSHDGVDGDLARKAGFLMFEAGIPLLKTAKASRGKKRNPAPTAAQKRKHLAHEREEEATFKAMLDKLPVGVTLKAGKHRIRKLSRGYVVVDGVRLTDKEAAKKIHRG